MTRELLFETLRKSSAEPLGTELDIEAIRSVIRAHIKEPRPSVGRIGWLSPTLVIAKASWYAGELASGRMIYIVQKRGDHWEVIAHYTTGIT